MLELERLIRKASPALEVVVEVGACSGEESLALAADHPTVRFVAIEANPSLAAALRRASAGLSNYTVVEAAVASEDGQADFLAFDGEPGIGSLNPVAEAGRQRYGDRAPSVRKVEAKRLSTICDELRIDTLDVLHVDTQGSDLDVFLSLDQNRLERLSVVSLEAARFMPLYEGAPMAASIRSALGRRGFRIFRIDRVHFSYRNECNYYFVRSNHKWFAEWAYPFHVAAGELRSVGAWARHRVAVRTRVRQIVGETGTAR